MRLTPHLLRLLNAIPAVLLALGAPPVLAQSEPNQLTEMVVTATRVATPVQLSPVAISSVGVQEIERQPVATVADLIRDLPGVLVADNSLPGMQRIRIRGESARRSLILIDGQETSDHTTYGPPLLIDPAFIKRIEVVRGPHSTLYGSRAEGGVINIITRGAVAGETEGFVRWGYSGATAGQRAALGVTGSRGAFDWFAGLSRSEDGDRRTPIGRLEDTRHAADSASARLGWTQGAHRLALSLDHHDMWSEASTPDRVVDGVFISAFQLDLPKRTRNKAGLSYDRRDFTASLKQLHADVFWQVIDREFTQSIAGILLPPTRPPTFYEYDNADVDTTDSWGANASAEWRWGESHQLVTGLAWLRDDLEKQLFRTGRRIRAGRAEPVSTDLLSDAAIGTSAIFVEDTWAPLPGWQIVGGARHYWVQSELTRSSDPLLPPRQDDDSQLIGSLALVRAWGETTTVRARWSQGYVYPTLLHLHTGSLFAQGNVTRPNPNLVPETSENFEVGLRWNQGRLSADVTAFASHAQNYIASVQSSMIPGSIWAPTENSYANLTGAETRGLEWALTVPLWSEQTTGYVQGTYLRREVEYPTFVTTADGQPRLTARAGLRWQGQWRRHARWHLDFYACGADRSTLQTTRSLEELPGWVTANFAASIEWGKNYQWSCQLEALNLTDETYRPSNDELLQPGAHFNVGLRLSL